MSGIFKNMDYYRKIPQDLTVSTSHGFMLSFCSIFILLMLFYAETASFLSPTVRSSAVIDTNTDHTMRITFNITLQAIGCDFATINTFDVLGSRHFNVSQNIKKYTTDDKGNYLGKHRGMRDDFLDRSIKYDSKFTPEDIHQLHEDGEHAVPMTASEIDGWLASHSYTLVNYYAPWCSHCVKLAPAYEALAEKVNDEQLDVSIVKIDCEKYHDYCMTQRVHGFPTLRLFKENTLLPPDYNLDRTVESMFRFLKTKVFGVDTEQVRERQIKNAEKHKLNYGCQLVGHMIVNRVPGSFHVEARSSAHDINAAMTNMSVVVNHLSFGPSRGRNKANEYFTDSKKPNTWSNIVPAEYYSSETVAPMNNKVFTVPALHQSYHHYLKVISTHFGFASEAEHLSKTGYQYVASSSKMSYNEDDVPKAVFSYDLSPMSIVIEHESMRWYTYICSVCAVIGGSFTVVGLLSNLLALCFDRTKR